MLQKEVAEKREGRIKGEEKELRGGRRGGNRRRKQASSDDSLDRKIQSSLETTFKKEKDEEHESLRQ